MKNSSQLLIVMKNQFELGLDIGSSLAITYEGEMVVDIWAGTRDRAQSLPWEENTIVTVFSSTKCYFISSLCSSR